jgi:two-component sensor histidine kinase
LPSHQSEGTIKIKLKSFPDEMELTIADDGIGIPENIDTKKQKNLVIILVNT